METCEACGGDATVFEDHVDKHGEHYTTSRPCPDCQPERDEDPPDDYLEERVDNYDDYEDA